MPARARGIFASGKGRGTAGSRINSTGTNDAMSPPFWAATSRPNPAYKTVRGSGERVNRTAAAPQCPGMGAESAPGLLEKSPGREQSPGRFDGKADHVREATIDPRHEPAAEPLHCVRSRLVQGLA